MTNQTINTRDLVVDYLGNIELPVDFELPFLGTENLETIAKYYLTIEMMAACAISSPYPEINISKNIIGCYFNDNRLNIYFGVKICENIVILINKNNYAEGILIYGKFEIENDRFYWKK